MVWNGPTRSQLLLWVFVCALAELLGIGFGAAWWVSMDNLNPEPASTAGKWVSLFLKALSGVAEGTVLGGLQAVVLRRIYPGLAVSKWVGLTVVLAVFGWAVGSAFPIFGEFSTTTSEHYDPPLGLTLMMSALMGLLLGAVFGAVQMLAFRNVATRSYVWIVVNALGWGLALPVIYAAASMGSLDTQFQEMILQALVAGVLAGLILGGVTGLGLLRMAPTSEFSESVDA